MPPKHKTADERLQLHTSILDAARELFIERGVEATTMREIAKRIGYSPTALYLHFKDKDDILRALCETDFLALAAGLQSIMGIPDVRQRLSMLCDGYAEFALSHPNHYRLMFMTPQPVIDKTELKMIHRGNPEQDAYAQLKSIVQDAFEGGHFRPELTNVDLISQTLWAGIHGACSLQISKGNDDWVEWRPISERIQMMRETLMIGILRPDQTKM
ncbi:MAG: TetR/AcrR family transcriptional regulator [Methylophilaceae bacterium]|nr:TetR/AcrR family transcriptional regulator [Methyloradius sp.]